MNKLGTSSKNLQNGAWFQRCLQIHPGLQNEAKLLASDAHFNLNDDDDDEDEDV